MAKRQLSSEEIHQLRQLRWKARTDLEFLAREILGYKNTEWAAHGPILDQCQKFLSPKNSKEAIDHDKWVQGKWEYKPLCSMAQLPHKRRRLLLASRSTLKTTLNTQAHTIQWILNYPDIAMVIFQSNEEKVKLLIREIKRHFQYNPVFRTLFPEHCPQKGIDDWGTVKSFVSQARSPEAPAREPTLLGATLGTGTAGMHFHVMKYTDIVEPENVKTQERIASVIQDFNLSESLLVAPNYWMDVEGTRYVFGDLYGEIIERWFKEKKLGQEPEYQVTLLSCYKRQRRDGEPCKYTPDELEEPYATDKDGNYVSWWAYDNEGNPRLTLEAMAQKKLNDPYNFSAQYENNPVGGLAGKPVFILGEQGKAPPHVIDRDTYRSNVRIVYRDMVVDTAYTTGARSDFTAIIIGAWDGYGRCYVEEIKHGQFQQRQLVDTIVYMANKYKPEAVKWEKSPFNEGLHLALSREMALKHVDIPLLWLKRDNQTNKIDRISSTLPGAYASGMIRFLRDLCPGDETASGLVWEALRKELKEFPLSKHDDILDALTDLFQERDNWGRLNSGFALPDEEKAIRDAQWRVFTGISDTEDEPLLAVEGTTVDPWYRSTGGL